MKVYKIELQIIDFDEVGEEDIQIYLENAHYPNDCIAPLVRKIDSREYAWSGDEDPLNKSSTAAKTFTNLFNT